MTQARPVLLLDFDYTLAFPAAVYLETAWNVLGRLIREHLHTGDAHVHAVLAAVYKAASSGGFTTAALVERTLARCGTPAHLVQSEARNLAQEIDEKFWAILTTQDCLFPDVCPALSALSALDIDLLLVTAGDKAFQTRKLHSMCFERLIPETRWVLTDVQENKVDAALNHLAQSGSTCLPPWLVLVDDSVAQLKRASDAFARHNLRGTLVQLDRRDQLPTHLGSFASHELKSLTLARTHFGSLAWTYSNLLEFARAFEQHLAIHDASWRRT